MQVRLSESQRADLAAIRLTYLEDDGEAVLGTEERFEGVAPAVLRSVPSLSPGQYRLDIELAFRSGVVTHRRQTLSVPSEGTLRISLEDER